MARLVPAEETDNRHAAKIRGWLEDDDPFFREIDRIVESRSAHLPRVLSPEADDES